MLRLFAATILVVCLSSCSALFGHEGFFRDRGDDYLKANEIPPMKVPDNLDSSAISELFVVPPISNEYVDIDKRFEAPRPGFISSSQQTQVTIQKLDARRWIAMNVNASEVWPRVQRFLEENKMPVIPASAAVGEIETGWLVLDGEPSSRDRYKIRVEQGIHASSCEIHIIQITVASSDTAQGQVNWPAASVNPDREKWLLDKLANYLTRDDKSGASLLAQSLGGPRKVEFVQPYQADPFLVFTLDMDRTWASLGGALGKHPYAVVDADRDAGIYHFSYDPTPPDDGKHGFFCRLIACDKRANDERIKNLQYYRIQVVNFNTNEIRVFVQNSAGEALPHREAEKLLTLIRNLLV
jgi:outer membrane protein assembly factor BamC